MTLKNLLASLFLASLYACGGDSSSYADPVAALEAGSLAQASGDSESALAAFEFAVAHAGDQDAVLYEALLGLGETQAAAGDLPQAMVSFGRAQEECAAFDVRGAQRIIDAWISKAGDVDQAKAALAFADKRFPEASEQLAKQREGIEALASGDSEALSALGYVGD